MRDDHEQQGRDDLLEVGLLETLALVGSLELFGELIIADAASVYDRAFRENIL